MNRMFATTLLAFSLFTAPLSVNASEKESLVNELVAYMQVEKQLKAGLNSMMPMIDQMAADMNLDEAGKSELIQIYKDWFEKDLDTGKFVDGMVTIYSAVFTENEIKDLIAFYKTPTGQKMVDKMPLLMSEGSKLGMKVGESNQHLLVKRLEPFIEKQRQ